MRKVIREKARQFLRDLGIHARSLKITSRGTHIKGVHDPVEDETTLHRIEDLMADFFYEEMPTPSADSRLKRKAISKLRDLFRMEVQMPPSAPIGFRRTEYVDWLEDMITTPIPIEVHGCGIRIDATDRRVEADNNWMSVRQDGIPEPEKYEQLLLISVVDGGYYLAYNSEGEWKDSDTCMPIKWHEFDYWLVLCPIKQTIARLQNTKNE